MAIRPGISLNVKGPDIGDIFSSALMSAERTQGLMQGPARNRLLDAQVTQAEAGATESGQLNRIRSLALFGMDLGGDIQSGNLESIRAKTLQRIGDLPSQGLPSNDSTDLLQIIDDPNISREDKLANISQLTEIARQKAQQSGAIRMTGSAGQRETDSLIESLVGAINPETNKPFTEETARQEVSLRQAGITGRAQGSAEQTITSLGTAADVAETRKTLSKAGEEGKLGAQLKLRPEVMRAVKLAEKGAIERGDVLTDLARMNAALPGLTEVVTELKELAPLVTSTFGGRVFDFAVKESGFGATKGSTAKARFIALISNQILPLLKPTFGGSFTVTEGDELKATMGDPNASADEKIAALEVFMAQKERSIRTAEAQVGTAAPTVVTPPPVEGLGQDVPQIKFLGPE